jgi:uncharacterized membrane protein YbhN (UPF0104 family)
LPGGIWALPSRAFLYHQNQISNPQNLGLIFWESVLSVCGAAILAIFAYPLLKHSPFSISIFLLLGLFLVLTIAGTACLQAAWMQALLDRFSSVHKVIPQLQLSEVRISVSRALMVTLFYAAHWLVVGTGFAALVYAFDISFSIMNWLSFAALFATSWAIGFLFIVTPGGIGIRDALLMIGLNTFADDPIPLIVAVLARIGWSGAELSNLLFSTIFNQLTTTPASQSNSRRSDKTP